MNYTILALIFAILSPIFFASTNIIDKFLLSKKVKRPGGFVILAGIANLIFGIVLSLFLSWEGISFLNMIPVMISGTLLGFQYFVYYRVLKKADTSNFLGLVYVYPLFIALVSFIFLGETLSFIGYLGVLLIILGTTSLSLKIHKMHGWTALFMILFIIFMTTAYEFLIKVSVSNLSEWNGIALEFIFIGLAISSALFFKNTRRDVILEFKNIKWAFLTEAFTFLAVATTFLAMVRLKATIVSSIVACQPLVILLFENTTYKLFGKLHKENWKSKIIPISLIVIGIIVLYLFEVI